jgi:hypothetical protein
MRRMDNYALCTIPLLPPGEFNTLALELFQRMYMYADEDLQDAKGFFNLASKTFRQDWPIGKLHKLAKEIFGEKLNLVRRPI